MKKKILAAALGAAIGLSMTAASTDAHGVFFANRVDTKALVLGEGPLDNAYDPACVQRIDAYDVNFQPTTVERVDGEKNITIVPGDDLGVTATFFDYGYFAKTTDGKVDVRLQVQRPLLERQGASGGALQRAHPDRADGEPPDPAARRHAELAHL